MSDDSDDDLLDLGSPPSYHPDDNDLLPAETNVAPGMLTGCSLGLVTNFLGVSDFHKFHLINHKHLNNEEELQDVSTAFRRVLLMLFGFATHETIKNAQAINQNFADTLSLFFACTNSPTMTLNKENRFSKAFPNHLDKRLVNHMEDKDNQLFFSETHEPRKMCKNTVYIGLVKMWLDKVDQCTGQMDLIDNTDDIPMKIISFFAVFFQQRTLCIVVDDHGGVDCHDVGTNGECGIVFDQSN